MSDVLRRLRGNWEGYLRCYRIWLVLLCLSAAADAGSTIWFMMKWGVVAERHPVIRMVSWVLGPVLGPVAGKLCQLLAVVGLTVFFRRQAVYIFVTVIILYGWAAWYNMWGWELYYPRVLDWLDRVSG